MSRFTLANTGSFLLRGVLVAALYMAGLFGTGAVWGALGLPLPGMGDAQSAMAGMMLSALVIGITLGSVAPFVRTSPARHVAIWFTLLFFNIGSVTIEGLFFAPDLVGALPLLVSQQLAGALIVALAVTWLFAAKEPAGGLASTHTRSPLGWAGRFVLAALVYLAAYWLFGALNYMLVTRTYYESNPTLAVPSAQLVLAAELVRAPMIAFSLVPLLIFWRAPRRRLMLTSAALLFLIGGVVPLLWQIGSLPTFLLIASGWEILAQNGLAGLFAAWLLAPPAPAVTGVPGRRFVPSH